MPHDPPPTPLAILLAAMHAKWRAGELDAAVALARIAAPYLHPRAQTPPPPEPSCTVSQMPSSNPCSPGPPSPASRNPAEELELRAALRASLLRWAECALAPLNQVPAAHHRLLIDELQRLESGRTRRLMVLMPPGAAKSSYASVLFPAWFLARHKRAQIIATAHTLSLARHFGRQIRALIDEHGARLGIALQRDSRAAHRFAITAGGEYYAAGIRAPIIGRRADLAIVDDPIRSQAEADSPRARDQLYEWFRADLTTRLKPRARLLLVMTRWHPEDLAGRLLAADTGDAPSWRVIRLAALAGANDPLGRPQGAALWPEWEDAAALAQKRQAIGERAWQAQFQQEPRLAGGAIFTPSRITRTEQPPAVTATVRAWDLAATPEGESDPDYTVGAKLARLEDGRFIVLDLIRLRGGPADVEQAIRGAALADGPNVPIGLPQDPGQAGRAQVAYLTRQLAGYRVVASPETGSKRLRAAPLASQANAGNLMLLAAPWNASLLDEMAQFPHGPKDDQVDALSRAFTLLLESSANPARRMNLPLFGR